VSRAEQPLSGTARSLVLLGTLLSTMMQALDTTIANVAIPHMQGSLSAGSDQIAWVLTSYIVASAIATAPAGYLANRFGIRRVFLVAVSGFVIASVLCGLSSHLIEIVAARLLQGMFGAALMPLAQTTLLDIFPREKQGSAMAAWGFGVMIGPILGPGIGGWLTEVLSWRWVFFINVPIGIVSLIALSSGLQHSEPRRAEPLDFKGFAFLSIAIGALQLALDRGQSQDWLRSTEVQIEFATAIAALYLFVVHSMTTDRPFLSPMLLKDRNLVGGLVMMSVMGIAIFSVFALLPPFLQNLRGYSVADAGLLMMPRGIGNVITLQIAGNLVNRVDARWLIATGMLCIAGSTAWMAEFTLDVPTSEIVWSGFLSGVGMGFVFVPLTTITFSTLPGAYRSDGTAVFNLMRNVGSSAGIALAYAYQDFGTKMARSVLVENVTPFNPNLTGLYGTEHGLQGLEALPGLLTEIERQAAMIGLLGDFHYLAIGLVCCLPLLLLFKPPKEPVAPPTPEEAALLEHG